MPLLFRMNPPSAGIGQGLAAFAVSLALVGTVWADKADRNKPLTMESDKPCTLDLVKQVSTCSGNVVISQGTLQLRAERIELRETPEGYRSALAIGTPGQPATYRQRRDGAGDEFVEGNAERIEFDGRADVLRFTGNASVRRIRQGRVADEVSGSAITWDNTAELFSVQGGASSAGNPGGRVRAVLAPREAAASTPASSVAPAAPATLKPSTALGERR